MTIGPAYGDGFAGVANFQAPGAVYIQGSEFIDGSVRIRLGRGQGVVQGIGVGTSARRIPKIEERVEGVWNTSELELGQNSLLLGPNLSLGALGASLRIESLDGQRTYIPMDVPIDNTGSGTPRALLASATVLSVVGQPDFSVDTVSTAHIVERTTSVLGYVHVLRLKVGAVAPTKEVLVTVLGGAFLPGPLYYEKRYDPTKFPANTEITLDDPIDLGTFIGDTVVLEVSSEEPFSLLGDATLTPWFGVDIQPYVIEDVLSHPTGFDRILFGADGNVLSSNEGEFLLLEAADGPT